MVYLQRWHGWCHNNLLPESQSRRVLCTPYNHAPCHFMQSHIRKVYACLAVTCHLRLWQNDRGLLRATSFLFFFFLFFFCCCSSSSCCLVGWLVFVFWLFSFRFLFFLGAFKYVQPSTSSERRVSGSSEARQLHVFHLPRRGPGSP